MTVNAGPEYFAAEKRFFAAQTPEEQVYWMEEMIRQAPKHKSSESFVANLKQRLKRLQEKQEKAKKSGRSSKKVIKKEGFQIVLVGLTKSGKSSLLAKLTNARPEISSSPYTTVEPIIGTFFYRGFKAQMVDLPSIGSELFDIGIVNTADLILIVISNLFELEKISQVLERATKKRIIVLNKSDLLDREQLRKLNEQIKSKKLNAILVSCLTEDNLESLKELIIKHTNVIRIYTKEPGKPSTPDPVLLPIGSSVKDVAESIRKGFSLNVKESRVTGPSSKFPNQKVGLSHILKDLDIVEFHTR